MKLKIKIKNVSLEYSFHSTKFNFYLNWGLSTILKWLKNIAHCKKVYAVCGTVGFIRISFHATITEVLIVFEHAQLPSPITCHRSTPPPFTPPPTLTNNVFFSTVTLRILDRSRVTRSPFQSSESLTAHLDRGQLSSHSPQPNGRAGRHSWNDIDPDSWLYLLPRSACQIILHSWHIC